MSRTRKDEPQERMPLKPVEFSVLLALAEEDRYGYEIVKRIAERTGGGVRLAPGNLYQVLDRLMELGLIAERSRVDRADLRRRYYGITGQGRKVLAAEASRLREMVRTAERLDLLPGRSGAR
jgi:DNA-binding PadR family transcriptional regulator